MKKHFLTGYFGRSEIYFFLGKKTDYPSQYMRSDKLQVEYLGTVKVQKREEGIPTVYDLE